jgi:profilin
LLFLTVTFQGDGAALVKTKQAVLVAEYIAPIQAGEATPVVEGLADYLINVGY